MTPVSSVTAFIARAHSGADPDAAATLAAFDLDDDARAVLAAQAVPAAQRRRWLESRTGRSWTAGELGHVESRAFTVVRRQLHARGLMRG